MCDACFTEEELIKNLILKTNKEYKQKNLRQKSLSTRGNNYQIDFKKKPKL